MSLDFVILAEDGAPEKSIGLDPATHHDLIAAAARHHLTGLNAFADYYADTELPVHDLPTLVVQLLELRNTISSPRLQQFLNDLEGLITQAIAQKKPLHVLAD